AGRLPQAPRQGGAGHTGEAEASGDRRRERLRGAGEYRPCLLAGSDHECAVRSRWAVSEEHVGRRQISVEFGWSKTGSTRYFIPPPPIVPQAGTVATPGAQTTPATIFTPRQNQVHRLS